MFKRNHIQLLEPRSSSRKKLYNLPWAAAATGNGVAVENMKERPRDCMSCFHLLLLLWKS